MTTRVQLTPVDYASVRNEQSQAFLHSDTSIGLFAGPSKTNCCYFHYSQVDFS
jgi:hypothetical protein